MKIKFNWKNVFWGLIIGTCMILVNLVYAGEATYNDVRVSEDVDGNRRYCYSSESEIEEFNNVYIIATVNDKEYNWYLLLHKVTFEQKFGKWKSRTAYIKIDGTRYVTEYKVISSMHDDMYYYEYVKITLNRYMVEEMAFADEVRIGLSAKDYRSLSPYNIYTSLDDMFRAGMRKVLTLAGGEK